MIICLNEDEGLFKIKSEYKLDKEKQDNFEEKVVPFMKYPTGIFIIEKHAPVSAKKLGIRDNIALIGKGHTITNIGTIQGYEYDGEDQYIIFRANHPKKMKLLCGDNIEATIYKYFKNDKSAQIIGWVIVEKEKFYTLEFGQK